MLSTLIFACYCHGRSLEGPDAADVANLISPARNGQAMGCVYPEIHSGSSMQDVHRLVYSVNS
jgi:hypothetical protein